MQPDNEMTISFLNKSDNEAFARVVAASFVSKLDPTVEEIAEVKTAVSEAVTNAIIHAYGNRKGYIRMSCKLYQFSVEIVVEDDGRGIKDVEQARQPLYTSCPELERSGMGFTIMESFMDKVEVISFEGMGTKVVMLKEFASLKNDG